MRKFALFILCFGLTLLSMTPAVMAASRPLSKNELLDGVQNWRKILKNIPSPEARENDLQQEFLFRLQFLVERRYDGTDESLLRLLQFMRELEERPSNMSSSALNGFLEILIRSLKEVREPQEAMWPYIQQFMVDNSLQRPVAFEETVKQRDYLNQFESLSAKQMSAEEINQYFIAAEIPKLEPSQTSNIGKLEESPGPKLAAEATVPNSTEGEPDVGPIIVIDSQESAVEP